MTPKRVTIRDIASAAGVSVSLVSFVMNNELSNSSKYRVSKQTSEKILKVAKALNYQPNAAARSLRFGKTRIIGVLVSDISNEFFSGIARHIEDLAYKLNYTVIFSSSDENIDKFKNHLNALVNRGVDGIIIVPCKGCEKYIKQVLEKKIPIVLLDRNIEDVDLGCVKLNNFEATQLATRTLVEAGCKKIDIFTYSLDLSNHQNRVRGYKEKMIEVGLAENIRVHEIDFYNLEKNTEDAVKLMMSYGTDAAIFTTNRLTINGIKTLNKLAKTVPDDISIIGFEGGEAFDLFYRSITHIHQPIQQLGENALTMLVNIIEKEEAPTKIIIPPRLILGNTIKTKTL